MRSKLHIPRFGVVMLALGGACGDDAPDQAEIDPSKRGGEADAEAEADAEEAPDADTDAGADDAQTGDSAPPDTSPSGSVDVGDDRILAVTRAFCKNSFACDAEASRAQLEDEEHCVTTIEAYTREDLERDGEECADAQLDLWECYANASCEELFTGCVEQVDASVERCPTSPGDE